MSGFDAKIQPVVSIGGMEARAIGHEFNSVGPTFTNHPREWFEYDDGVAGITSQHSRRHAFDPIRSEADPHGHEIGAMIELGDVTMQFRYHHCFAPFSRLACFRDQGQWMPMATSCDGGFAVGWE